MIRALRPTDLPAFLAFRTRAAHNEAVLSAGQGAESLSFREMLGRSLALRPGIETWVQIENGQIHGMVSARARFGTDVWDIDQLLIAPSLDEDRVCLRLLDHLCAAAVEEGVMKVFLRLPSDSSWATASRQAGFVHYTTEQPYVHPSLPAVERPVVEGLRPRRPADHLALFHLYSAAVPAQVRQIEAMTLQEWRWNDNWGLASVASVRPALSRRRRDMVVVHTEGEVAAWLQVQMRPRTVRVLCDGDSRLDAGVLLRRALAELPPSGPVGCPVREYQRELVGPLEELGFAPSEEQELFARLLAARIPERRLVPARVV
jgi:N-acetylglutamate synthase-like GNAT family acetyltransferase